MWFNSTQRAEPYRPLTCRLKPGESPGSLRGACTGAAWLSSARVVRCWVKSRNERNPRLQLPAERPKGRAGDSEETAGAKPEEGGDDVKSSWSLRPGPHTCYNGAHSGSRGRKAEPIPKARLSSDRGLQPAHVKLESLVIVDQLRHGEYVPGPCTHRPSRHGSRERPKSVTEPRKRTERPKASSVTGAKS